METDNLLYGSNLVLRPNRLWTVTLCLSIKFTLPFHSAIVRRHNPWSFYLQWSATLSLYIFLWYHVHRINSYMWSVLCVCTLYIPFQFQDLNLKYKFIWSRGEWSRHFNFRNYSKSKTTAKFGWNWNDF